MSLQNTDLFVVQRGNSLFKVPSSTLKDDYGSTAQVHIGENPPPGDPVQGDLWWSTLEGNLFIWYNDGDSKQWVDASPAFIEIDYERIEDYLDQSVLDNAVAQIKSDGIITVDPSGGKGVVTIGADTSALEDADSDLQAAIDQEIADRIAAVSAEESARIAADLTKVDKTEFETDQARQDALITALQEQNKKQQEQIDKLQDQITELLDGINNVDRIDGGANNAFGDFNQPNIDGGDATGVDDGPPVGMPIADGGADNADGNFD